MRGRDTHLAGAELSHAQFELLIELDERGELSAGELALRRAHLRRRRVTQMLDRLAESRPRRAHALGQRPARRRRAADAARAARKIEAKRAAWRERWERALGDVSPRELRAATRVLERLGAVFEDGRPREGGSRRPPRASAREIARATGRKAG